MKILLLFLLLFSSKIWAQKSISAQVFQVNVRPILQAIIGDFYQMIGLFPNYPKELLQLSQSLNNIENEKEILSHSCSKVFDQNCLKAVDDLRLKLLPIEISTSKILNHQTMEKSLYLNNLSGLRIMNDFYSDLVFLRTKLNNASFFFKSKVRPNSPGMNFVKLFDDLVTQLSLATIEFIPQTYKNEFKSFYFNFIHPIEKQTYKTSSYKYFNQNLKALNFSINLLNQNLTKRNKKTPEGMAPFLSTIHTRWNSIIRYYL